VRISCDFVALGKRAHQQRGSDELLGASGAMADVDFAAARRNRITESLAAASQGATGGISCSGPFDL